MNQFFQENIKYDVAIIGAGVIGSAIARELMKYKLSVIIVEKSEDVCTGTSKANSAIIHGGFDAKVGSLKAKMNVKGNKMMDQISKELDVPFRRNGSMVLCFREEDKPALEALYERGKANGVENLRLLSAEEAHDLEPNLADDVVGALFCPTSGIVCPFELTLAFAENAVRNGAQLVLDNEVLGIKMADEGFILDTQKGQLQARTIVNAAGVVADKIHDMVLPHKYSIVARKGEYCLFDKKVGNLTDKTLFQMPTKYGKGVLVTPTIHGNLLIGPTATDIEDVEDKSTTQKGIGVVLSKAEKSINKVPTREIITSFAGLRAHGDQGDFVLEETAPGFFEAACIESPGLSSAPAIGQYMAGLVAKNLEAEINPDFNPIRKAMVHFNELTVEEQKALIQKNPMYGKIVCRCEKVTQGEIIDAIHGTIGATTLDGIKRRTRAGSGRCQAGFCTIKVMEILSEELKVPFESIRKKGKGSQIALERTK